MNKQLYRVQEVSEITGLGVSTIWAWIKQGRFPQPIKLGKRSTFWTATDIDKFINDLRDLRKMQNG